MKKKEIKKIKKIAEAAYEKALKDNKMFEVPLVEELNDFYIEFTEDPMCSPYIWMFLMKDKNEKYIFKDDNHEEELQKLRERFEPIFKKEGF